jgi:archaellum component FlaF (FlaF/FlaG flagellin family)
MTGQVISLLIGAVIVYFTIRALFKTFKNAKEGRCSSCSEDCSSCMIWDGASNK